LFFFVVIIVWRCRQRQTGVEYAAKVIDLRRWRGNADVMRSIRREISILRSLDHACVVRLEEWYESRDEIVLVTDIGA
jgi:serine/threonine protein kinase